MSGGTIVVKPSKDNKLKQMKILLLEILYYMELRLENYLLGKAGERFAVRNSGGNMRVVMNGCDANGNIVNT